MLLFIQQRVLHTVSHIYVLLVVFTFAALQVFTVATSIQKCVRIYLVFNVRQTEVLFSFLFSTDMPNVQLKVVWMFPKIIIIIFLPLY